MSINETMFERFHRKIQAVEEEIKKVIVGQEKMIRGGLICLLAGEHLLIEGVPGLAKTKFIIALSKTINAKFERIQCTPDLLPSDVLGMMIYSPKDGTFQFKEGPISTNILLVDEINRGTPKTKSAFLQAMQEREVTVGDIVRPLPKPFMVLATMNPIEQEGVYPLIEAEKDRFMMKIKISYPSFDEGVEIVIQQSILGEAKINQVLELKELLEIQDFVKKIYVDPKLIKLACLITQKTRPEENRNFKEYVQLGASPRASMRIIEAARIQAFFEKNDYALPRHIRSVVHDVLRHRIILVTRPGKNVEEVIDDVIREVLDYEKE